MTAHIPVMTAPTITARQAVAAFDATRIEAARVAGHPVPRCAVPTALRRDSVAPDGSTAVFFWLAAEDPAAGEVGISPPSRRARRASRTRSPHPARSPSR